MKLRDCWLEITNHCNARCVSCTIWKKSPCHELSLEEVQRLFCSNGLRHVEHLYITGGEPFLRDDLAEIVNFVYRTTACSIGITTNGLLPEKIASTVARMQPAVSLDISLNGTELTHDITRGITGAFNKVVQTYERLRQLGVTPAFLCTILPHNIADLTWIQEFSRKMETSVNFALARPVERIGSEHLDIYSYSSEQKYEILSQLPSSLFKDVLRRFFQGTLRFPCLYGSRSITISCEGNVYACSHFVPAMRMGSIREESIDTILLSQRRADMVSRIQRSDCQPCSISLSHAVNSIRWSPGHTINQRVQRIIRCAEAVGAVIGKKTYARR